MGNQQIREGSTVTWDWGNGQAEGKVEEIYRHEVEKTLDGTSVKRKGTDDNPAYLISQEDGSKVLKLREELNQG